MKDIKWLVNRLKAMNPQEVLWRAGQKRLEKKEKDTVYSLHKPVTDIPLPQEISHLHIDTDRLPLNPDNSDCSRFSGLDLFGVFNYESFKNKWNAGFQTENTWPEEPFSPSINIGQRTDIGDIRTNWELSRHFQFAALAKTYYCTGEEKYLQEFEELFSDWNSHNLFLHGVEWTSAMELAIRVNSWVYALAFLKMTECPKPLLNATEHGILVMADYISKHRARFSSANNHLIVEMYAVALVGVLADYAPWRDEALKILTEELPRQNCADGVNREMSLHYQSFVMEAYGLLWLLMMKNKIEVPALWKTYLTAMTEFVADSTDDYGSTMEFGDSDDGKILDLNGKIDNHYQYVLSLMGCILDRKYTDAPWHENLSWIVPQSLKTEKEKYIPGLICSRREGGYTFLRSKDRRVLIGIDHAQLGFGSLAAHGHADALSFQMFIDGQPVFVDSGMFNYHVTPEDRDVFRSTAAHNTVMVDGQEQSEMLGPFMWGKRAKAELEEISDNRLTCKAVYGNTVHRRMFEFDGENTLVIRDDIGEKTGRLFLHLAAGGTAAVGEGKAVIDLSGYRISISGEGFRPRKNAGFHSDRYGSKTGCNYLTAQFDGKIKVRIQWEKK